MVDYALRATHAQTARPPRPLVSFRGKVMLIAVLGCAAFWAGAAALVAVALRV